MIKKRKKKSNENEKERKEASTEKWFRTRVEIISRKLKILRDKKKRQQQYKRFEVFAVNEIQRGPKLSA